jgi:hypothetical protein
LALDYLTAPGKSGEQDLWRNWCWESIYSHIHTFRTCVLSRSSPTTILSQPFVAHFHSSSNVPWVLESEQFASYGWFTRSTASKKEAYHYRYKWRWFGVT